MQSLRTGASSRAPNCSLGECVHVHSWMGKKQRKNFSAVMCVRQVWRFFLLDLSELVAVTQNEVHVLIESFKRPDEYPTILQNTAHPVVDVLKHLTALPDRLPKHTTGI